MNKIIYTAFAAISILTLLIIILACLSTIVNNVYAPPFGGPKSHFSEPSPHFSEPTTRFSEPTTRFSEPTTRFSEPTTRFSEPIKINENIVKNTIKPTESRDTKEAKINEILHLLDTNTISFDKKLKQEIWKDAYTFANTVIVPFMGKTMVKLLLFLAF